MTQQKKRTLSDDPWAKLVSPLPWADEGDEVFIYDANGVPVATTDKAWLPYDVRIANNRFIIKACNCHDELLTALKDLLKEFQITDEQSRAAFERARVIIAKSRSANMPDFTIGQKVLYRGAWGTNNPRLCTITGKGEKNDRTVYDNSLGHWGYAYQYEPVRETQRAEAS